ncbi:extracellular solute-binding protein [Nonomuraea salmonea]
MTTEFTKQHPNVTWDIREDQFAVITQNAPRVLADNPPDLMRLPQVSELVKDDLLKNLDGYATAFGWDKWPASQLEQLRLGPGGRPRGEGSLYALGLNMSMTGLFYNKKLATQIGMSTPPATLAELDQALKKAKDAGITPIVQFNGGATGGLAFPLQNLMASYGPAAPINDWIYQKPGATIDTPTNLQAVQHLERWIKAGYFQKDVNAVDYATMMSRFIDGQGLFMFNGDWESGNLDKQMAGDAGFTPDAAGRGGRQARRHVGPAHLRHRRRREERRLRRLLPQLGRHRQARPRHRRRGRGIAPDGARRRVHAGRRRGQGHRRDPGGRGGHRRGRRRDGLHRQRHRRHLRQELDAEPAEAGGRPADAGGSAEDGPGRLRRPARRELITLMARPARRLRGARGARGVAGWLFVVPALAFYAVFVLRPIALTVQYSLYEWNGIGASTWVGLANYGTVFTDPDLLDSLINAFQLIVFFSVIPVVLGLAIAATIRRIAASRLALVARTVLFLPQVIPLVAAGIAWSWLLASTGVVNQLLSLVGLGGVTRAWLGDFATALPAVGMIGAWVLLGLCTLLLLAGMSKIDPALYEAARLDGAGAWREFVSITVPSLRQEIAVCVTVTVIAALASFDIVYIATQGGPGNTTMVPGLQIFYLAFTEREVGTASALAVVLMLLVIACALPIQWFTKDDNR